MINVESVLLAICTKKLILRYCCLYTYITANSEIDRTDIYYNDKKISSLLEFLDQRQTKGLKAVNREKLTEYLSPSQISNLSQCISCMRFQRCSRIIDVCVLETEKNISQVI